MFYRKKLKIQIENNKKINEIKKQLSEENIEYQKQLFALNKKVNDLILKNQKLRKENKELKGKVKEK